MKKLQRTNMIVANCSTHANYLLLVWREKSRLTLLPARTILLVKLCSIFYKTRQITIVKSTSLIFCFSDEFDIKQLQHTNMIVANCSTPSNYFPLFWRENFARNLTSGALNVVGSSNNNIDSQIHIVNYYFAFQMNLKLNNCNTPTWLLPIARHLQITSTF